MVEAKEKRNDRPPKGLTAALLLGIMLSMGPLFGALVAVAVLMRRTAAVKRMVAEGIGDAVVEFPLTPVVAGFAVFPIGLVLVWLAIMQMSDTLSLKRSKRVPR